MRIEKIISGGQSGVDRGALDAAIALKIPHGGWCPRGRLAEDGIIPSRYDLKETDSGLYHIRTERNVLDADGTLILYRQSLQGGTEFTRRMTLKHAKPRLIVDLARPCDIAQIREWIEAEQIRVLNVAGPRESSVPGIADETRKLLERALS